MAKAVAIVPVGHDFPPFSANKGGAVEGSKIYLLTYDLAFQIQEQLRSLDGGAPPPPEIGRDAAARGQYVLLLRRLLRQWAIPPARQFNRLPSRARVVMCAGLSGVWQYSRGDHDAGAPVPPKLPPMTTCQVINHTPAGYALRQTDGHHASLRIGDLIALRVEGRPGLQVAMVRWFRNTFKGSGLEFGCELLSDAPEAAAAVAEHASASSLAPVVVLPEEHAPGGVENAPAQIIVPAGVFQLEQAVSLRRGENSGFAVLTKLVEQGPGFELYEYVAVPDFGTGPALPSGRAPPAAPAGCALALIAATALMLLELLWELLLAPLRPGGSWLALKALPLALLLPGVARGALRPRQVLAFVLLPLLRRRARPRADRSGPPCAGRRHRRDDRGGAFTALVLSFRAERRARTADPRRDDAVRSPGSTPVPAPGAAERRRLRVLPRARAPTPRPAREAARALPAPARPAPTRPQSRRRGGDRRATPGRARRRDRPCTRATPRLAATSRSRLELELLGLPTTITTSTSRVINLTASCRFCVA